MQLIPLPKASGRIGFPPCFSAFCSLMPKRRYAGAQTPEKANHRPSVACFFFQPVMQVPAKSLI
jgi:hypothetical protein